MILLWGRAGDPPLDSVRAALEQREAAHLFVDQCEALPEHAFRFGDRLGGHIAGHDLAHIRAAYIRPQDDRSLVDPTGTKLREEALARQLFTYQLSNWLDLAPIPVVNRLSAQASNTSKLYQQLLIAKGGFDVPPSRATSDPQAARRFATEHERVIYKSLSSVRSIVRQLPASEHARLEDVQHCPTLFQKHIAGTDYRVHVVGDRVFNTMLWSDHDDYRYDHATEHVAVELPVEVASRCVALTSALGLLFSGIDLRRSHTGEWICFEVNPSPGFSYFDSAHNGAIASAVADALVRDGVRAARSRGTAREI